MVKALKFSSFALLVVLLLAAHALALDPNDPFDFDPGEIADSYDPLKPDIEADRAKSAEQLIAEAAALLSDERLLDARTKLLHALEKEPENYEAHLMLGGYYLAHVGHFRLALKYIKRAEQIFESKNGKAPYKDEEIKNVHARILYLLAETRLNLDNYKGSLETLDQFERLYSYGGTWYFGSRAWVLMKLGQLDEAVRIAKLGVFFGAEPGRTLNILGILLSMINQRKESLEVFNKAIRYELSLGKSGQPATPLNNSGEVYRETFDEDKAEASFLKATSMPDGCEHVLPSLNLANLYIEQLRFQEAKDAMDRFEACVAQYTLRNGEEHRALVNLARGRIALHTGHVDEAISNLNSSLERRQWFGKIGTSIEDHVSAATVSLAQAMRAKNNLLKFKVSGGLSAWIAGLSERAENDLRRWWLMRRARQILTEDLSNLEDIYIRHTDSMLEYHTLGEALAGFPMRTLDRRIKAELKSDDRAKALPYYSAYLVENYLNHGEQEKALELMAQTLPKAERSQDRGLRIHLLLQKLSLENEGSSAYRSIAEEIYQAVPAELRNFGFRLPVNVEALSQEIRSPLLESAFYSDPKSSFTVLASHSDQGYSLELSGAKNVIRITAKELEEGVDQFAQAVFSQTLR